MFIGKFQQMLAPLICVTQVKLSTYNIKRKIHGENYVMRYNLVKEFKEAKVFRAQDDKA